MSFTLSKNTFTEMLTLALETLYAAGPPIIKLCSTLDNYDDQRRPDFGIAFKQPTDKVLGVSTSKSYAIDADNNVTFLEIDDFFGLEVGVGTMIEVWDATGTDCYYRFLTSPDRPIAGNNDIIRLQEVVMNGYVGNTVVQQDDDPAYFPVQYKIKFPSYLIRTDIHRLDKLSLGFRNAEGQNITGWSIFGAGASGGGTITSRDMGYSGVVENFFVPANPNLGGNTIKDYYYYTFEWIDELNCILTFDTVATHYDDLQMFIYTESRFYSNFDDYPDHGFPEAPFIGTLPADAYSGVVEIERKRNFDPAFVPMVVETDQEVNYSYQGIALPNPTIRFSNIQSYSYWDMLS